MSKKKEFEVKKEVEWKIKHPEWISFFGAMSAIFCLYWIIGVNSNSLKGRLIMMLFVTIFYYILFGKYPYWRKTKLIVKEV